MNLILIVAGSIVGLIIIYFIISILKYSSRSARIKYWYQGYYIKTKGERKSHAQALRELKQEFCASKYAAEEICKEEFNSLKSLVEVIIMREFSFGEKAKSISQSEKNFLAGTKWMDAQMQGVREKIDATEAYFLERYSEDRGDQEK